MADISAADVKKLRDTTGAGMMECKKALEDAAGDFDKAKKLLRERGLADAAKRKGKSASEGLIATYLHTPSPGLPPRVGVMLELATETDFVAKTGDVQNLAQEIAMHIAAAKPIYVDLDEVPEEFLEEERDLARKKVEGKPDDVVEKAVEGSLKKFAKQLCLLDQPWIRDEKQTIRELLDGAASKIGENLGVRRFIRFEVAEDLD